MSKLAILSAGSDVLRLDNVKRTIVLRKGPLNINTELNFDFLIFHCILEKRYNS